MKRIAIIFSIILCSTILFSQSDVIYPTTSKKIIKRCNITEVKNNVVHYVKGKITDTIEAIAIVRDDIFIDLKNYNSLPLFKNHDFDYYKHLRHKSKIQAALGLTLTIVGIGAVIGGNSINTKTDGGSGSIIIIAGIASVNVGLTAMIMGLVNVRKSKKAMELTKRKESLSFGITNNGLGLVLNF